MSEITEIVRAKIRFWSLMHNPYGSNQKLKAIFIPKKAKTDLG